MNDVNLIIKCNEHAIRLEEIIQNEDNKGLKKAYFSKKLEVMNAYNQARENTPETSVFDYYIMLFDKAEEVVGEYGVKIPEVDSELYEQIQ